MRTLMLCEEKNIMAMRVRRDLETQSLDPAVQVYTFQEWNVTGKDLLCLSSQQLDALGVRCIGHQEIILEAIEQLCALHYELHAENLRSLTEKLYGVSQSLWSHILSMRKVASHSLSAAPTPKQLVCIIDIVAAARGLFSWLNRYLFARLNDYSASRDVIVLCLELAESVHKDWSDPHVESRVVSICQNICGTCESILNCSPEDLLNQTATLEPVLIKPELPHYNLGIEIKSTSLGQHFVCGTTAEAPAGRSGKIFPGDEIIKVNDQVVVGWTRKNLVYKLQEKTDCVTLVLKKVSIPSTSVSPTSPTYFIQHSSKTTLTAHSEPSLPKAEITPVAAARQSPSHLILALRKSTETRTTRSAPVTPTKDTPSVLNLNSVSTSPVFSDKFSFTNKHNTDISQNQDSSQQNSDTILSANCPWSPTFWESTSVFPLSPLSPENFDQKTKETKALPITEADTLQNTQCMSRPRSGSDSFTTPTASPFSATLFAGLLRPALSDSNLKASTDPAVLPQPNVPKEVTAKSPSIKDDNLVSKSPQTAKSPQVTVTKTNSKQTQHGKEKSPGARRKKKGVATKLSRRRVSCRDLGNPDCDGWLTKKKENAGFMTQKWKRCWCVLKGDRLYWYNVPQDEKALGLVNISSYKLESAREPKKKYEFQLCHPTYKPFVFAADSLSDLSKWVTSLLAALNIHKTASSATQAHEEDCYSETEAEDLDEDHSKTQEVVKTPLTHVQSQNISSSPTTSEESNTSESGQILKESDVQPANDTLESLISCLQQGGVSLIGAKTVLTRDDYRKSFVRRNKNPEINQKAHALRALQSTLKAKLLELEALNQILENPSLSSAIFQKWKSDHGQLYETLGRGPKPRSTVVDTWAHTDSSGEEKEQAEEMV
ncbi:connector enhancer of kinase suppressor of ras 1 isoform X1 [Xenopus tropicalis]|uniref:Connector enhancer of kinase suppressor of Ras 1 n=1 Tax=Xenopus tropicalis TaxID=8364 RepID=A0A803JVM8_XENTR|nr:connector enhancer of kinase suppressor of ras 1 isoform X1 [Xenopus tropicalis]